MPNSTVDRVSLLVSVRNLAEAGEALAGGADIIDVKEPNQGPLGRADSATLRSIATNSHLRVHARITAALGELTESNANLLSHELPQGWHVLKVGLAGMRDGNWRLKFREKATALSACGPLIPVAYADCDRARAPEIREVLDFALDLQVPFFLIDTFGKDGRRLLDWLGVEELSEIAALCHSAGVKLALAGSLTLACVERLRPLRPDVIAVRGAVCAQGLRDGTIDSAGVRAFRNALDALAVSVVRPSVVL